ncbi:MAG: T9SS type A sorting domain-containing protein, partial [Bacteroidetes bacterium]|nr:T9SS type A sorting domain-containing protein [Bacteroidota bacterium]MCL2303533.1 T9SS type A sorting domain-containing protein [Lentimicrobiaceae bacterium]
NHVKVEIEVGIDEYLQPNFSIVPNPAANQIIISSASPFHTVEVINFLGQTMVSETVEGNSTVNISNLNNGIYFVRVVFESGSSVRKLVKQ